MDVVMDGLNSERHVFVDEFRDPLFIATSPSLLKKLQNLQDLIDAKVLVPFCKNILFSPLAL